MSDKKRKKAEGEMTFVVTNNPLTSSAANQRAVRSVAAFKSWPERRKKTFEQHQSRSTDSASSSYQGGFVLDFQAPSQPSSGPSAARTRDAQPAKKRRRDDAAAAAPLQEQASEHADHQPQPRPQRVEEEPLFEKCIRAVDDACKCAHCDADRQFARYARAVAALSARKQPSTELIQASSSKRRIDLAMLTPPSSPDTSPLTIISSSTRTDPFGQYPVYQPWFDRVLHHMMNVFAPRGWPALKITNAEGLRWEQFMTLHALAEPALFYVRLLFATGDLIRLNAMQPEVSYWLQDRAVQAINEALSDPKRATSDALILAVGRIALHENLYGDRNAANTIHRPAQKRMIALRGGMAALPFPELVKRLMRWADTVMAKQSGTERMLEDENESRNFTMRQHVDVLEKWVPSEGHDLRKKIRIADLLSDEPSTPP